MRKKKFNILILMLLTSFPLTILGAGLFFCCQSTGFNIQKITSKLSKNSNWEVEVTQEQQDFLLEHVFSQTFYYLGRGNHSYAFVSEDQRFVLKFFKMHRLFPREWLNITPLFPFFNIKQEMADQLFSERIFSSYKDAYERFREESGLIYIHLNKTQEFRSKVKLVDNQGKSHFVDMDRTEFVVQKRAKKIYTYLDQLLNQNREKEFRAAIRAFLQLIAARCEKGFVDFGLGIRNNFGFVGGAAVQFDCATLQRDPSMKYPANFRKEILTIAERLNLWMRNYTEEASFILQEEVERLMCDKQLSMCSHSSG